MKKFRLILMLFVLPVCALAQGAQYTGIAQTARNMIGMGNVYVPIPGASVNVCTGVYTGTACPSGGNVTVYSNQALTTALTQPITADNYGNFTFWAAPGAYYFTVTGQGAASSSYQLTLPFGISGTYNATAKSIEQVRYADQWCTTSGTLDQSCIANALASNVRLVIPAGTYNFASQITVNGLSNFEIDAQPEAIIKKDGEALECDSCSNFRIKGLTFETVTQPTVVTKAQLPASGVLVIDRFGSGKGYIPTSNDSDIVPTGSGGNCATNCLTAAQSTESFDTGLILKSASHFRVSGLSGNYYSILCYDCDHGRIDHNDVMGGKQFAGGIVLWNASGASAGNVDDEVDHNVVTYAAYSGITVSKGTHVVVDGNVSSYNGESGIKQNQGSGNYSANLTVTGNSSDHNWFDGFDLSEDYPHAGTTICGCSVSGNVSSYNHSTGFYMDGQQWTVTGNHADNNGTDGMSLDLKNSSITANELANNNTSLTASGVHQLLLGAGITPTDDVVASNEIFVNNSAPGNALNIGGDSTVFVESNRSYGATDLFTAGVASLNNSDSTGLLSNTNQTFSGLVYQTNNTGSTLPAGTTGVGYTVALNNAAGQGDVDLLNLFKATQNGNYAFRWFDYDAAGTSHQLMYLDRAGVLQIGEVNDLYGAVAASGFLRMTSGDQMCWRNNANSADLCFSKDASDVFNIAGTFNATTLRQGGANVALSSQLPLSGSVSGSTTALAANTCGDVVTQTVTGAATTMTPVVTVSGALPTSGLVIQSAVTATNTVSIEYCNVTTGSVVPAAATLEIRVIQ